jgi:hypothetical protein
VGKATLPETHVSIRGLTLRGGAVSGSVGLKTSILAYAYFTDLNVLGFDTGWDATDTEQVGIYDSFFRFNNHGIDIHPAVSTSDANSWSFFNTVVGNNTFWGLRMAAGFNLNYFGGSIYFNGSIACGGTPANCWGASFQNIDGVGVGAGVTIKGVDFEGNGGTASIISNQTNVATTFDIQSNTFNRNTQFSGLGFGTNDILIQGNQASTYKLSGNMFTSSNGYTPSAGRPVISVTNSAAMIADDGTNIFSNSSEAPATIYPQGQAIGFPRAGPSWQPYTVSVTAGNSGSGGAFGSVTATGRWYSWGKSAWFAATVTTTNIGTAALSMNVSVPFTTGFACVVTGMNLSTGETITGETPSSGGTIMSMFRYNGTFPAANGNQFVISGGPCEMQ